MPAPGLTILQVADLQCGKPFLTEAGEALVLLAERIQPDVVVAAGDLTQRAKTHEYRAAMELLGRLPEAPLVTTPGNHDVPLYRLWERAFTPFRNWRRHVCEDLDTVTRVEGATFVTLASAAPRRAIVNGRLRAQQLDFADRSFGAAPGGDLRCLVVHHHFVPVPGGAGGPPIPGAARLLRRIEAAGADLVLGGHVHQTHVATSRDVVGSAPAPAPGVPIVACGTTTSRRGRGAEAGCNSLNVLRITEEAIEVTPYAREAGGGAFEPREARSFSRARVAAGEATVEGGSA